VNTVDLQARRRYEIEVRTTVSLSCLLLAGCPAPASHVDRAGVRAWSTAPVEQAVYVGSKAPTEVVATARDGSWVLLCQAREDSDGNGILDITSDSQGSYGDQQHAYLVLGSGDGEPIDDIIAVDPSGRRAVIERDQRLMMIQPGLGSELDLTALRASRDAREAYFEDVAFDPTGEYLVYSRELPAVPRVIVIRELASGKERVVDPGPGQLDSFSITRDGHTIEARVFAMRPGDQPWQTSRERPHGRCWTSAPPDSITVSGTPAEMRRIPFRGVHEVPREIPGFIGFVGDRVVARAASGALMIESPGARPSELSPASCVGHIVAVSTASVIVACNTGALMEVGKGTQRPLGVTILPPTEDNLQHAERFLAAWNVNGTYRLIDLRNGAVTDGAKDWLLAERGSRSLLIRDNKLVVVEATGERVIADLHERVYDRDEAQVLVAGSFAYISPGYRPAAALLVDMTTGTVIGGPPRSTLNHPVYGHVIGIVLGLANDGRLLASFPTELYSRHVPGPLEWVNAGPIE
jgi:hypothetical protein